MERFETILEHKEISCWGRTEEVYEFLKKRSQSFRDKLKDYEDQMHPDHMDYEFEARVFWTAELDLKMWGFRGIDITITKVDLTIRWASMEERHLSDETSLTIKESVAGETWELKSEMKFRNSGYLCPDIMEIDLSRQIIVLSNTEGED